MDKGVVASELGAQGLVSQEIPYQEGPEDHAGGSFICCVSSPSVAREPAVSHPRGELQDHDH